VLKTMRERAAKFNTQRIKQEDLASAAVRPTRRTTPQGKDFATLRKYNCGFAVMRRGRP